MICLCGFRDVVPGVCVVSEMWYQVFVWFQRCGTRCLCGFRDVVPGVCVVSEMWYQVFVWFQRCGTRCLCGFRDVVPGVSVDSLLFVPGPHCRCGHCLWSPAQTSPRSFHPHPHLCHGHPVPDHRGRVHK